MASSEPTAAPSQTSREGRRVFVKLFARLFRLACLVGIVYWLARIDARARDASPLLYASSVATGARRFGLGLVVLLACSWQRRFFCRYVCPLGTAVDAAQWARRKSFKNAILKNGARVPTRFFFAFFSVLWLGSLAPGLLSGGRVGAQGLSALEFDPLAILSRTILFFPKPSWIAIAFLVCYFVSPYLWRFGICPCGALQEALYLPKRFILALCAKKSESRESEKRSDSRRQFFAVSGAIALSAGTVAFLKKFGAPIERRFLRPPGARSEPEFLALCARCGRCSKACPNLILRPIGSDSSSVDRSSGLLSVLVRDTPEVSFGESYCEKDCAVCSEVCPTGAIARFTPKDKSRYPIAVVEFKLENCLLYQDRECSICRRECPYEAISFVWNDDAYANVPQIDETRCVGCGRCVSFCPGSAEGALVLAPRPR
ncbi:MAG: 4Fe-4S dicluster domain-containing protein [Thermoguttaceae bacterium]|nr:4Fe-4S dicluster domain-containing protein [Thermoguttaceae bacterium]